MADEKIKLPIRSALIPIFYKNFRCLMGACQDNCCDDGWRIEFSKKDYLAVKRAAEQSEELQALVDQGMRRLRKREHDGMYAEFCITGAGRCAFHTQEGLCRLQLECGEETLPAVCRTYPRRVGYTPAAKEYSLSPSCEGVLQQLWDLPEGVEFVEDPLPPSERATADIPPGDNLLIYFEPVRSLLIDVLQNRALSLTERMLYLGVVLQRLQKENWDIFDPDVWTKQVTAQTDVDTIKDMTANIPGNRDMYLMQNLQVLDAISKGQMGWPTELYKAVNVKRKFTLASTVDGVSERNIQLMTSFSKKAYEDALEKFQAAFSDREYFFENLMVAAALHMGFPALDSKEKLWEGYVSLCNLYSFYRFVSVLGCKEDQTKERLFHMIVVASRATLHDSVRFNGFQEELFQHDSSTLAHMAILLSG